MPGQAEIDTWAGTDLPWCFWKPGRGEDTARLSTGL